MKNFHFFPLLFMLLTTACTKQPDHEQLFKQIVQEFNSGNLKRSSELIDSLKATYPDKKQVIHRADSLSRIAERIYIDFPLTEDQVVSWLDENIDSYTQKDKKRWENNNWLEYRMIDDKKRYFYRATRNLRLIKNFYGYGSARDSIYAYDPVIIHRKKHTKSIMEKSDSLHLPVEKVDMTINYTLTVDPDAVPAGETVRCWLPYPKENNIRQQNVKFLSASNENYIISPDTLTHRTIYMEETAVVGRPVIFKVSFSYRSSGQYFNTEELKALPYNTASDLYRKYTAEQPPHINFSDDVKLLADSITGNEENPFKIVRKIYYWINENIPWSGAIEYSIMPDIPAYVLKNRRGDCGMQTFLLMSMLRYKGIPVKWQSGWVMPPGVKSLHDWCEVYYEGTGWVPLDISYGLQYSDNQKLRDFYISGIDSYRLIVNDGVAGELYPSKKHLRSEPYDFQRGEVEWRGGNIYFDKWDYNMEREYIK